MSQSLNGTTINTLISVFFLGEKLAGNSAKRPKTVVLDLRFIPFTRTPAQYCNSRCGPPLWTKILISQKKEGSEWLRGR